MTRRHPGARPAAEPARAPRRPGGAAWSAAGRACAARCRWPPRSRSRSDFPHRDQLLFLTFAVIFATLVLQGLTLPAVIRWSASHDDGAEAARSCSARRRATEAALAQLDELAAAEWTRDDTAERMRGALRVPPAPAAAARAGETEDEDDGGRAPVAQVPEDGPVGARRAAPARSSSCATRARSPTRSCTGSSASSTSRTSGSRSSPSARSRRGARRSRGRPRRRCGRPRTRRRGSPRAPPPRSCAARARARSRRSSARAPSAVCGVAAQRRPDAAHLVGGDRGAGAGPAADDGLLGAAVGDVPRRGLRRPRPVVALSSASAPCSSGSCPRCAQRVDHGGRHAGALVA